MSTTFNQRKIRKIENNMLILSILCFVLSLPMGAYYTENGSSALGFMLLIVGWFGAFLGGSGICWLANPLLLFSWMFYKTKSSLIFSGLASYFVILFYTFDEVLLNEAGHYGKVVGYKMGYWLWSFSPLIVFFGKIWLIYLKKNI